MNEEKHINLDQIVEISVSDFRYNSNYSYKKSKSFLFGLIKTKSGFRDIRTNIKVADTLEEFKNRKEDIEVRKRNGKYFFFTIPSIKIKLSNGKTYEIFYNNYNNVIHARNILFYRYKHSLIRFIQI